MLKILIPSIRLILLARKNFVFLITLATCYLLFLSFFLFFSPLIRLLYSRRIFFIDSITIALINLTFWVFVLIILARWNIFTRNNKARSFYFWCSFLILILIVSFSINRALFFYFSFEASLIPIMVIILGWGYQPERLQARVYIILYTVAASLPLLLTLLKIFRLNNSLNFHFLFFKNQLDLIYFNSFIWILVILAFLVKIPIFLFHLWLPKAHVEAPVAGSIILAGVLLKLGRYGFLRIAFIFPVFNISFFGLISSLCLWGAVITGFICLRQVDIKALIAYSSVGHMGILLAGSLRGTSWGWERSLLMMLAHGVCSSGIFIIANTIYEKTHNRSLFLTKGLLIIFPSLIIWWFLLNIVNMAAPPSINLARELILVASTISCSSWSLFFLGLIRFITAAYRLFLFTRTAHGNLSNYLLIKENLKSREYLNILSHWVPLNLIILKLDILSFWF